MDRSDFYYKQNVTHTELDQAFSDSENADRNLIEDQNDSVSGFASWGILNGFLVSQTGTPSLSVEITDGVAYDNQGRRIPHTGGPYTLDLTSLQPGSDQRYVRIYAEFDRALSDPRVDGLGASIDYRQTETVTFSADAGAISASPVKPAVLTGKVLIATVLMVNGLLIQDARISQVPPTATDADGDSQPGGAAIAHGRQNDPTRIILYAPGSDDVIDLNGNGLQTRGGNVSMDNLGDQAGGDIYMERGGLYTAEEVRTSGSPFEGKGYWYVTPSAVNPLGDLKEIYKAHSWDGSAMLPADDSTQVSPWVAGSPTNNSWYVDSTPIGAPGIDEKAFSWRLIVNTGGGYANGGLMCPLVGLPRRAKLSDVKFRINCLAVDTSFDFGVVVYRRNIYQSAGVAEKLNGSPITWATVTSTGQQWFNPAALVDTADQLIIYPDLYSYYAVFYVKSDGAQAAQDIGLIVQACKADYLIREASGEYTHPTL